VVITHKGPKIPGKLKIRPETELDAVGEDDAIALLGALGYQPLLHFEKRRDRWRLDGCNVELDMLPGLGSFIEIEGPGEEAVMAVRQKLGLAGQDLVSNSYLTLLVRRIEAGALTEAELVFSTSTD
jgi:predicted adenylyl cyclase CyaB